MYMLFHAVVNAKFMHSMYFHICTYTQHLMFHYTYILRQKINQILFAYTEYLYLIVFLSVHIRIWRRCFSRVTYGLIFPLETIRNNQKQRELMNIRCLKRIFNSYTFLLAIIISANAGKKCNLMEICQHILASI